MTTTPHRRLPTGVLVAACCVAWLAALSGRAASLLAVEGLLPQSLGWMVWPRGPGAIVRYVGAALALAFLVWVVARLARPRWVALPVIALGLGAAFTAPGLPYPGADALFAAMRPQLEQVAELPAVTDAGAATHRAELPSPLRPVAVRGYVSADGSGGVFVPQWAALVDDAGGFWFTPGTSPEGRDMWGMACTEPTRLDGDWWVCGMNVNPGGTL